MDDIRYVATLLSEEALLEQLVEECGELVQAAAKRLRIYRGEKPHAGDGGREHGEPARGNRRRAPVRQCA